MKKEYPPLAELKTEYGRHKIIPAEHEEVILKALSHFPELKDTHITFTLTKKQQAPYSTTPSAGSILRTGKRREYIISLLDEADPPMRAVLFKNLPEEAQRAVIAHELAHVIDLMKKSTPGLVKTALSQANLFRRRDFERAADISVIEHGLGFELYVHAVYIRKVPGYVQMHKEIDTDYLKPQEILDTLPEGSTAV